jgi:hypothetical protein
MENMKLYEMARTVPQEAIKPIQAGRLKGMSDINPMYRIKRLTEMFGPCGVGWWYEITRKEITFDDITNQKCAFVDINLYYTDPETGHDSHAIPGTGGASFVATERNGPYMSDECYKMAVTDALSVAMKMLGMAADVYKGLWDGTKYKQLPEEKPLTVDERCAAFINFITKATLTQFNDDKVKAKFNALCKDAGADKAEQLNRAWQCRLMAITPMEGNNA